MSNVIAYEERKSQIGERIKKRRKKVGYKTQTDLARELRCERTAINAWEAGKRLPTLDNLQRMCALLDCEIGYLLCDFDCTTREAADIREVTGLSEEAINTLKGFQALNMVREGKAELQGRLAIDFDLRRRVAAIDEEVSALNFLIEHGVDLGFFRKLWDYLWVNYFSEGDNNPTHEGDTAKQELFAHLSRLRGKDVELKRIKGSRIIIKGDTPKGERNNIISIESLNAMHRIELMDMLLELKKIIGKEVADNGEHN